MCEAKVRHTTRRDAQSVLNRTVGNRVETMAPYPCKFCWGWHNGHSPLDATRDLEPPCACKHLAITHDSFPGLGCRECDCLQHREWVYRAAIKAANDRAANALRLERRSENVIGLIFAKMPTLGKRFLRRYLRTALKSPRPLNLVNPSRQTKNVKDSMRR
jgi:hypothetical protein